MLEWNWQILPMVLSYKSWCEGHPFQDARCPLCTECTQIAYTIHVLMCFLCASSGSMHLTSTIVLGYAQDLFNNLFWHLLPKRHPLDGPLACKRSPFVKLPNRHSHGDFLHGPL